MSSYASPHIEIAITGRGVVSSIGEGADAFVDALLERRSGVDDGLAPCSEFDPEAAMGPKLARRSDRYTQLGFAAAMQACAEAGLPGDGEIDLERLAILVGTGVGGLITLEGECRKFVDGGERAVSPHFVPMMMPNAAAGAIAMELGAHGPGFSVSSACATGSHAIGEAKRMLERGEADVVVAGGTEAAITPLCVAAFKRMGALSREGQSRPFDARRDGFVLGEGAGVIIMERREHAESRGAEILGYVAGYGASNDAFHMTQPDNTGRGAEKAMRAALADAGVQPQDVGYINAHGTSTPFNDRIETVAIHSVFNGGSPPVSSTKSAIGHLLGAAGAVEAVATLEALRRGLLPPTLNFEETDPDCDLDYVPDGPREAPEITLALSNSFGFGGQNACLAFRKAP
ncbi:MAG: 3-oxoacyl-[acyl-carrier-protein] synthase, KASII [uncultured Solirubrobacteraceae bacterium]|uniref:3-oxoacyl-[acyl-carrier-protein] synthase, KASII n=1 Tax=uncultured Solirubrobacteraceae bacterium TaxID=1162706 RepID=A0A6J4S275_9ACTN|nr:MAG: 3-oxoacyl-[acyl-carrier-protein] synthase, KASII [uncultured Solirubrobacteraceae bacterium]